MKGSHTKYLRFATAAEAVRYAIKDLRTPKPSAREGSEVAMSEDQHTGVIVLNDYGAADALAFSGADIVAVRRRCSRSLDTSHVSACQLWNTTTSSEENPCGS